MYFEFVNRINKNSFKDLHSSIKSVKWKTIIIFCILFAFFLCVYAINKQLLFGFLSMFFGFLFALMLFVKMPFYISDASRNTWKIKCSMYYLVFILFWVIIPICDFVISIPRFVITFVIGLYKLVFTESSRDINRCIFV